MSDDPYSSPPPIGGNFPPPDDLHVSAPGEIVAYLEYHCSALLARRDELLAAMERDIGAYPTIDTEETQATVAENRRMVETMLRTAEERRVADKRAFREAETTLDGWFKRFAAPVDKMLAEIKSRMDDFTRRQHATAMAAAQERAQKAEQEAQERREAAARAIRDGKPQGAVSAALVDAQIAEDEAAKAQAATMEKAAEHTRVRGTFGAVSSARTIWRWRIVDEKMVPPDLWSIDPKKVGARYAAGGRNPDGSPVIKIQGLESYPEISTQVR